MTDEFKKTLLQYLIGKLPNEQEINEPQLEVQKDIINNYSKFIEENVPNRLTVIDWLQEKNGKRIVIYGNYYDESVVPVVQRGAFIVFDENLMPVKAILGYDSGTLFRKFEALKIDEEGLIFGIDNNKKLDGSITNEYRFIMLNNIFPTIDVFGEYRVTLRASYYFPNEYNSANFGVMNSEKYILQKRNNASEYLMVCDVINPNEIAVIKLKINVGSENEWNIYTDKTNSTLWNSPFSTQIVEWTDDNLIFKIVGNNNNGQDKNISYIELTLNNDIFTKTLEIELKEFEEYIETVALLPNNETYLGISAYKEKTDESVSTVYKVDYDKKDLIKLYEKINPSVLLGNNIKFDVVDNNTFVRIEVFLQKDSTFYCESNMGLIYENKVFISNTDLTAIYGNENYFFIVTKEFNLYSLMTQTEDSVQSIKIAFNELDYNGKSYINDNSLISNSVKLYSNDNLIFARNLYNKSINNNITTSTVEIPNNYVNNIDITNKRLLSKTNLTMISDNKIISKNIYETLYINFINSLLLIDKNNKQILNQIGSNYLNNQINNIEGYSKAKIYPKVVITYQDDSSKEIAFEYQNTKDTSVDIVFAVFVEKTVKEAKIISNDKSITYQTIDLSNLEVGKLYKIKQSLEVV